MASILPQNTTTWVASDAQPTTNAIASQNTTTTIASDFGPTATAIAPQNSTAQISSTTVCTTCATPIHNSYLSRFNMTSTSSEPVTKSTSLTSIAWFWNPSRTSTTAKVEQSSSTSPLLGGSTNGAETSSATSTTSTMPTTSSISTSTIDIPTAFETLSSLQTVEVTSLVRATCTTRTITTEAVDCLPNHYTTTTFVQTVTVVAEVPASTPTMVSGPPAHDHRHGGMPPWVPKMLGGNSTSSFNATGPAMFPDPAMHNFTRPGRPTKWVWRTRGPVKTSQATTTTAA